MISHTAILSERIGEGMCMNHISTLSLHVEDNADVIVGGLVRHNKTVDMGCL